MAVPGSGGAFSITTPSATIELPPARSAEVPFTVTNLAGRTLRATAIPRGLGDTPVDWFKVDGDAEQQYEDGSIKQVRLVVDPALGAEAKRYAFRLDVQGVENPTVEFAEGPDCAIDVVGGGGGVTTPRGYVATLVGASAGGVLFLAILVVLIIVATNTDSLGVAIVVIIIGLFSFGLMGIASAFGIAIALRKRQYRGARLTAVFFGVLVVPWTVVNFLVLTWLDPDGIWVIFLLPITVLIVPALLARALVLLIRTHRI